MCMQLDIIQYIEHDTIQLNIMRCWKVWNGMVAKKSPSGLRKQEFPEGMRGFLL